MPPGTTEPVEVSAPVVKQQAPLALRLVFSFPVALSALLILLIVLTVRNRFDDPDMWWHLKTGEIIWNTHHIPAVDTFSYTTHNHAYVPHEWLAQLSIYAAYHYAGYSGLMLWLCVLGSLVVIGGYVLSSVYSGNAKVGFLGAMVVWLLSTSGLSIRPQLIGYLFLICELLILYLGRTRSARWFFGLPVLFAIWVNCHGSFFLGGLIGAIALACSFLELRVGLLVSEKWDWPRQKMLALSLALSGAALFINPVGWEQVMYPLDTMFQQSLQKLVVTEWQPLDMSTARGAGVLGVGVLILLLPLLRGVRLHVDELVSLGLTGFLALRHGRMVFVFGVIAAPILCRMLSGEWEKYELRRDRILPNLIFVAASLVAVILAFPNNSVLAREVEEASPVNALKYVRQAGLHGNMLNDYAYGGYIIWADPEQKVFVDGRGDVFEWTGVLAEYTNWTGLASDPEELLRKYNISTCLLPAHAPLTRVLTQWLGWKAVYSDNLAVVLVKR